MAGADIGFGCANENACDNFTNFFAKSWLIKDKIMDKTCGDVPKNI